MDVRRLARDERADFAEFLVTLSPQQWHAPTLCARWRVRDVVAHVISYDDQGNRALVALAAQARFRPGRINDMALARYDRHSPEQLLELLADHLQPRGVPAALGGRVGLVETLIHHRDIRRALRLPRAIPPERLRPALHTALIAPDGDPAGVALFGRLYQATQAGMHLLEQAGVVRPAQDEAVRDAFLLCNDLAVVLLRPHITQVTGIDPLSRDGLVRWSAEVFDVYSGGVFVLPLTAGQDLPADGAEGDAQR